MTNPDIAARRMKNQQIIDSSFHSPVEIVRWMGAVQSQDYLGAKWAVGLRAGAGNAALEQAVSDGSILRLHIMRPTWHFVAAEDLRWLLALTTHKAKLGTSARHRELEITAAVTACSEEIFREVLTGGKQLTRDELEAALNQGGISTAIPQRLAHLLGQAEYDGVLVSGAWRGKQATYTLFDERVPPLKRTDLLDPLNAAAELVSRFFCSHGPATLKDFTWWSGLTLTQARAGIERAGSSLQREEIDGQIYWGPADSEPVRAAPEPTPTAYLLPNYDEYVVAYNNREAIFDPALAHRLHLRGGVLNNVLVIDGLVAGGWTREFKKKEVWVTVEPLWPLAAEERQAVEQAANHYGEFLGMTARLGFRTIQNSSPPNPLS